MKKMLFLLAFVMVYLATWAQSSANSTIPSIVTDLLKFR